MEWETSCGETLRLFNGGAHIGVYKDVQEIDHLYIIIFVLLLIKNRKVFI